MDILLILRQHVKYEWRILYIFRCIIKLF
jgi:hypothetical protein